MIDRFDGEYFFLSNFEDSSITYDGITYKNVEAAFHAQKVFDREKKKEFSNLNPSEAKRLGRRVKLRSDWESVKVDIMTDLVRIKFLQNPDLKKKLLATGDKILIEGNWWNDQFWGVCKGEGQNYLGGILMMIRKELRDDRI